MAIFTLTQKAIADLKDIARFTQKRWGREQRNKYLEFLDASFHQVARNPSMGKDCDEIKAGYLKFPTGSHVIYYRRSSGPAIEIIRVLHESMDENDRIKEAGLGLLLLLRSLYYPWSTATLTTTL